VAKRGTVGTLWIVWAAVSVLLLTLAMWSSHTVYRVLFGAILLRWWVILALPLLALWSVLRAFGVA
jgi:hypothetical protein